MSSFRVKSETETEIRTKPENRNPKPRSNTKPDTPRTEQHETRNLSPTGTERKGFHFMPDFVPFSLEISFRSDP